MFIPSSIPVRPESSYIKSLHALEYASGKVRDSCREAWRSLGYCSTPSRSTPTDAIISDTMEDPDYTLLWPRAPKMIRKVMHRQAEERMDYAESRRRGILDNTKIPLNIQKLRKWNRLLISTNKITGGEGDRMRKYSIIRKSELEHLKSIKRLSLQVLQDFPPFIKGYHIQVSGEEVIFELYQENMDGTKTRVFRNETPQKIPLNS